MEEEEGEEEEVGGEPLGKLDQQLFATLQETICGLPEWLRQ